jgi:hypothetical protein
MPRSVEESVVIAASPEKIWSVLMDTAGWSQWNSFVTNITVEAPHTRLRTGSRQSITIAPTPTTTESYVNTVARLVPREELRWHGCIGHAMVFNTEHWCLLELVQGEDEDGRGFERQQTRFTQGERFTGLLAPMIGMTGKLEELRAGYARMNNDLKRHVERSPA